MDDPGLMVGLTGLFLLMAVLYSTVGQGGGSGYLAAMALVGVTPEEFRLIALTLNVVVASIGLVKFSRAGFFNGKLLFPFILSSVPLAFLGGYLSLPAQVFRPLVGVVLLWAAVLLLWKPPMPEGEVAGEPPLWASLLCGAGIGLLSGLIGIGGGIFLAPFLILRRWASAKTTACVCSGFILVNSLAALAGVAFHASGVPRLLPVWMLVVAFGGWVGSEFGAKRLSPKTLHWLLAAVLAIAGGKMILSGETREAETVATESEHPLPEIVATNAFYYYADVEAAWEFHTRILGFATVADYGFAKILQVGPTSFLTLVDEDEGMHSSSEPKSVTLAVVTDEVEEWWEYLSGLGVEMRAGLGNEEGVVEEGRPHDGFVAIDPEGYLLEFERFNPHPENTALLPILDQVVPLYPDGGETAPGIIPLRPRSLGVRGTVLWLYYRDLERVEAFYKEALGVDILVDQDGWAKVYPASLTGFLGFVDGDRGLHQATEEKSVTVSFFTSDLDSWVEHLAGVEGFEIRPPGVSSEGDFVHTLVGYDVEGYYLEWDDFLDVEVNQGLLRAMAGDDVGNPGGR